MLEIESERDRRETEHRDNRKQELEAAAQKSKVELERSQRDTSDNLVTERQKAESEARTDPTGPATRGGGPPKSSNCRPPWSESKLQFWLSKYEAMASILAEIETAKREAAKATRVSCNVNQPVDSIMMARYRTVCTTLALRGSRVNRRFRYAYGRAKVCPCSLVAL